MVVCAFTRTCEIQDFFFKVRNVAYMVSLNFSLVKSVALQWRHIVTTFPLYIADN